MSDKPTEFAIQAGALRAAIALASSPTERRNTIPVLAHLHLAGADGVLTLTGTNLDQQVIAKARGDGALAPITAGAAPLAGILAAIPAEETITLRPAKEGQIIIRSARMEAKLYALPPEDFPMAQEHAWTARYRLPAGTLLNLIERTMHAISIEETRYCLNGIYLHVAQGEEGPVLRATTTDGHRIMLADVPLPEGDAPPNLILPRAAIQQLRLMLARMVPGRILDISASDTAIEFSAEAWTLRTKVIDGTFPDYAKVMPADEGEPILVHDSQRLADEIRTVTAISSELSRPVKISNGTGAALRLSCANHDGGTCESAVPPEIALWSSDGAHPEIAFQARYMLDLCKVFRTTFTMRVKAGNAPVRISGPEGLAVLMPMRV